MAHTDIILTEEQGVFNPSQSSVPAIKGDSISFSTSDGLPVALFFSPGAVSLLSPSPSVPTIVGPGEKAGFSFTSSEAGAYSVFFERTASEPPPHYPVRPSTSLSLEVDTSHATFSGPMSDTRT